MTQKIILVLSSNFTQTVEWLQETFDVDILDRMNRMVQTKDGVKFYIVQEGDSNKIHGIQARAYLRAPDYVSLEDNVRMRVRR